MKSVCLFFILFLSKGMLYPQYIPTAYDHLIREADSLYTAKEYKKSAEKYSEAFQSNGWKGRLNDRYNAACSWALSGVIDSAFSLLEKIARQMDYKNLGHISIDPDLKSLHNDKRWLPLLDIIKQNKMLAEVKLNRPLVALLDSIYLDDQQYRQQLNEIEKQYGWNSKEMNAHWKIINQKDSVNLIKVKSILDCYGWLGKDVIGEQGNSTLFLVIQHADQATQEKYLPMMRDAVKNGNANSYSLALLEDRVALGQGKLQIYGSQICIDNMTQTYYVCPLDDPDNVDMRRASVGLDSLAHYVLNWQIVWDVEQYKKDLPRLMNLSR